MEESLFRKTKDGRIVYFGAITISLATPTQPQKLGGGLGETTEVSDYELKKLWPHRTFHEKYGKNKTETVLKAELISRGYKLASSGKKQKWQAVVPKVAEES